MVAFFLLKAASPDMLVRSFLVLLCCLLRSKRYYFTRQLSLWSGLRHTLCQPAAGRTSSPCSSASKSGQLCLIDLLPSSLDHSSAGMSLTCLGAARSSPEGTAICQV